MDTRDQQIRKLIHLQAGSRKVLSIYLGFSSKDTPTQRLILSTYHSLIHRNLSEKEKEYFREDLAKIETYIQESLDTHNVRSIVFFSDGGKLWEVVTFEFYLPSLCIAGYIPYTQPLLSAVEAYKKYLVIVADREKAVFFTVRLGEIEEKLSLSDGHVPQKVRANERDYYGRSDKILRHIDDHLHRHFQLIAKTASDFVRDKDISFIILAGHKTISPKLRKHLNPSLQKMVMTEFVTDLHEPLAALLLRSKKAASSLEDTLILEKLHRSLAP